MIYTPLPDQLVRMFQTPFLCVVFSLIIVWSLVWKGFALWRAAKNQDKAWFVIFLIFNTIGILEILYLCIFSKDKGISMKKR